MSYAEVPDVLARAGVLSPKWSNTSTPAYADIERFLDDVSSEVDQEIAALGFATPVTGQTAEALRGMVADGALLLLLEASFPGDLGGAAKGIYDAAAARYNGKMQALTSGTLPALVYLESTSGAVTASDFWTDEAGYGQLTPEQQQNLNPYIQPAIAKTDKFVRLGFEAPAVRATRPKWSSPDL